MSVSVCLSVRCQRPDIHTSRNFLYMLPVAVARSSSDDSVIRYVLPVLRMTSCLPIMDCMACGVGSIYTRAPCMEQVVINLQRIRQGAQLCLTLSAMTTCGPCGALPLVGGLQFGIKAGGKVCCLLLPCFTCVES